CEAGKSSAAGTTSPADCAPCQAGTYMNALSVCTVCPAGKYNDRGDIAITTCFDCPVGTYRSATSNANNHDSSSDCQPCPRGTFSSSPSTAACTNCYSGTYGPSGTSGYTAAEQCTICAIGKYASSGSILECSSCAPGKYNTDAATDRSLHDDANDCTPCAAGSISTAEASTSCTSCGLGQYKASAGGSSCDSCPPGRYNNVPSSFTSAPQHDSYDDCIICPAGTYASSSSSTGCADCPAGTYNSDDGASDSLHNAVSDCLACAAGKYSGAASISCDACPSGTYLTSAGVSPSDCVACEKGKSTAYAASPACDTCASGKYAPSTGSTACSECSAGRYLPESSSPADHDHPSDCIACAPGKKSAAEGQLACESCPPGSTSALAALTCSSCDAGKFAGSWASSSCTPCATGTYSGAGVSACNQCPAGSFGGSTGLTTCSSCPTGSYSSTSGKTACDACVAGKASGSGVGATFCGDCDPGFYSLSGASQCAACSSNTFSSGTGNSACTPCPPGQNAPEGAAVCSTCAGVITPTGCTVCEPGEYASAIACAPCNAGSRSSGGAALTCSVCVAGKYSSDADGNECDLMCTRCTECAAGKFSPPGSSSCLACPAGTKSAPGASDCSACDAGSYSDPGSSSCSQCEAGKYSSSGSSQCSLCSGGTYSLASQSSCTECVAGKFSGSGSGTCSDCAVGTYSDQDGMGSCINCAGGKFAAFTGMDLCSECAAGTFSSSSATSCNDCAAGKTSTLGAYMCDDCGAGKYSSSGDPSCTACSGGTYSGFSGATECLPCSPGFFCNSGSSSPQQNECGDASKYCPLGSSAPVAVETGYYSSPLIAATDLRESQAMCEDSYYCSGGVRRKMLMWKNCNTTMDVIEDLEAIPSSPADIWSPVFAVNPQITDPDISVTSSSFSVISAIDLPPPDTDDPTPSAPLPPCMTASNLRFDDNDGLVYDAAVDFTNCRNGVSITVAGEVALDESCSSSTAASASDCTAQDLPTCTMEVRIRNVNDAPEWISELPQSSDADAACYTPTALRIYEVPERSEEFTKFGPMLEDCVFEADPGDSILFSINTTIPETTTDDGSHLFDIAECGGQLFVKEMAQLRYIMGESNSYSLQIVATDKFGLSDSVEVTVNLLNVNDVPYFNDDFPASFSVPENMEAGTALSPSVSYVTDLDEDALTYSLVANEDDAFYISPESGELSTLKPLNFENKRSYAIKIQVTDNQPDSDPVESDLVLVNVENENDDPVWNSVEPIALVFPELTTLTDAIVGEVTTLGTDEDTTDSVSLTDGSLTYSLFNTWDPASDSNDDLSADFDIQHTDGRALVRVIRDTDVTEFNFEDNADNEFELLLVISDDDNKTPPTALPVTLRLSNVNEQPQFLSSPSTASVSIMETSCDSSSFEIDGVGVLPTTPSTVVYTVSAEDPDNNQQTFLQLSGDSPFVVSESRQTSDTVSEWDIILDQAVDFETTDGNSYTLSLKVTDGQLSETTTLTIDILNCNEAPVLTFDTDVRSVPENFIGPVVGNAISFTDLDETDGKVFNVVGGSGRDFFSVDTDGALSSTTELDFEGVASYTVQIAVTDDPSTTATSNGAPATSHALTYTIGVTNMNEKPSCSNQTFVVTESLRPDDQVGQAEVDDPEFTLSSLDSDSVTFEIVNHKYLVDDLTVRVTGDADECQTGLVSNAGECCEMDFELFSVNANEGSLNSFVLQASSAFVRDKPLNNLGGCNFTMAVVATDNSGGPNVPGEAMESDIVQYIVQIKGTNNAPVMENQVVNDIPENSEIGAVIVPAYTLTADDDDTEQTLSWFLVSTASLETQPFAIDPVTGAITVKAAGAAMLDFETNPSITLTVGVRDDGPLEAGVNGMDIMTPDDRFLTSALFDTAMITLNLRNMPEQPSFSPRQPTFEVSEMTSCAGGDVILPDFIVASDEDSEDEDSLTYSLAWTDPDNTSPLPFGIRDIYDASVKQNKGQLYLSACTSGTFEAGVDPLDFETLPSYPITITVTDSHPLSRSIDTEIVILDGNEPPEFINEGDADWSTFELPEDTGGGVFVGDMGVTDPDNDPYSFTLSGADGDNIESLFRIDDTGKLYTQAGMQLDFEDRTSYTFTVRADETGTAEAYFLEQEVSISVTDVNDITVENVSPLEFTTAGSTTVTFTGSEFGPTDPALSSKTVVTATYSGSDGVIYTAKGCLITQPNTEIQCTTVAGIGANKVWTVTIAPSTSGAWSYTHSLETTSYSPPTVTAVDNSELMPTSSATPSLITITGTNFGVDYKECLRRCVEGSGVACGNGCISTEFTCHQEAGTACDEYPDWFISDGAYVTYGPSESDIEKYQCKNARVSAGSGGTEIVCESDEGVGKNFYWQVRIGPKDARATYIEKADAQMSNVLHNPASSYKVPSIAAANLEEGVSHLPNNALDDTTLIVLTGDDFGNVESEIHVSYGDPVGKYIAINCVISVPHTEIQCGSIPGVGVDMAFELTVATLVSSTHPSSLSYAPPVIFPLSDGSNAVQGQGASSANTRGGEEIMIFGMNFGPAGDAHMPTMEYGPASDPTLYVATNCFVKNSFNKISCTSAPGTGTGHVVTIIVGDQDSNTYDANVNYKPPSVHYFEPEWEGTTPPRDGGSTEGQEVVIVHGDNFGVASANMLDSVSYGEKGVEYRPCAPSAAGTSDCMCEIVEDHTAIKCFTTEGTGKTHKWSITIDGQNSTVSTTKYHRPEILEIDGMVDADPSGGEAVTIVGRNFGNDQDKLEKVRYGPSGNEYLAVDCVVYEHTEIRCKTNQGVGKDLRWVVEIDSQASDLSDQTTNYAAPELVDIIPPNGPTEGYVEGTGMQLHKIRGRNFATLVQGAFVQVMFDGSPIVLDGAALNKAVSGGSFTGTETITSTHMETVTETVTEVNEDGDEVEVETEVEREIVEEEVVDYIVFKLPEMAEVHQSKIVSLLVGHMNKQNVEQTSGELDFAYDSPVIETIENIEGDLAGAGLDIATSDLVINGLNFGRSDYAKIYVNEVEQSTWTWHHSRISLNYQGLRGSVRVKVGDIWSNRMNFSDSSPELLYVPEYLPVETGYDTTGEDPLVGSSDLTIAGCFFQHVVENLRITVDDIDCDIYLDSLRELPPVENFCVTDTLRAVTCKVPEGTGEVNVVNLYRSGNPNYSGNNTVLLTYRPPLIESFEPRLVDTNGGDVMVTGKNFGNDVSLVEMFMGETKLEVLSTDFSHTNLWVRVPSGEGRPKPVRIVVDGLEHTVLRDDEKVVRYYPPDIEAIVPSLIPTTGQVVELQGSYFGREGKANAYLEDARDWISVMVEAGEHTELQVAVGEGQGTHMLALNVSGNIERSALDYYPPMIGSDEDRNEEDNILVPTGGTEVLLEGLNFGIGVDYVLKMEDLNENEDGNEMEYNSNFPVAYGPGSEEIVEFNHTHIKFKSPEGQNERNAPLTLTLTVAGQTSKLVNFDYGAPRIDHLAMCFPDATSAVYQYDCVTEMNPLMTDCDRNAAGGCGLNTEGGYTLAIMGENFGDPAAGVQKVFFGEDELTKGVGGAVDVRFVSHNQINIRVPPGVGMDIGVKVMVGDRVTNTEDFSYDPPFVEDVAPQRPDANGDYITIHGVNFAPTEELAGEISIFVGQNVYLNKWWTDEDDERRYLEDAGGDVGRNVTEWLKCTPPKFGEMEFPIWQQKGSGSPYLWCQIPRVTVGPKHIRLAVAGQNVTVGKQQELIRPACLDGFYGQEENAFYEGPIPGMCKELSNLVERQCQDVWDADNREMTADEFGKHLECMDVKHSDEFEEMDGNLVNCTVLTRQDEYFRQYGECAPCPSNPWMIVAILLGGMTFMGSIAYIMKKKRVSLGIVSIAIDYFQILSLLSTTKTPWPQVILDLYTWLSAFNFNINITAPECVFEVAYDDKWKMIMSMPIALFSLVFVYNQFLVFWKKVVKHKRGRKVHSHSSKAIGAATAIMYYVYMNLSMTALEVFNCGVQELEDPITGEVVSDGKQYMSETNWVCYEKGGDHIALVPLAVIAICVYTIGYPCYMAYVLFTPKNKARAITDQVLRAMDAGNTKFTSPSLEQFEFRQRYYKLYYYYKPDKWYWMLVVLGRKFSVAAIALLFRGNATFQMCMIVLTIFISSNIQVRAQPFMSMSERAGVLLQHREMVDDLRDQMNNKGKKKMISGKAFNIDSLMDESNREVSVASYFWNYNTVEMILLASAILINVFGIMFESKYLKEKSAPYEMLANLTVSVICLSLVYVMMVIWSEIIAAVFPSLECAFVNRFAEGGDEDEDDEGEGGEGEKAGAKGGLARQLSSGKMLFKSKSSGGLGANGKQASYKKKKTVELSEQQMETEMANMEFAHNPAAYSGKSMADELNLSEKDVEKLVKNHPMYLDAMQASTRAVQEARVAKQAGVAEEANKIAAKVEAPKKQKKVFGFKEAGPSGSGLSGKRGPPGAGGILKTPSGKSVGVLPGGVDRQDTDDSVGTQSRAERSLTFEQ
ncbi:hypothetical protein TeGR_g1845, partial [Tetraparma gracilis]